ncbi:jerky-like protein [Trichonephila clavipes]|nr:jerky-like protein [Trichonephila clavipes]
MVLVKEDNLPPLQWSLGRVVQVFPGDDGAVRVVDVKTQRGQFRRGSDDFKTSTGWLRNFTSRQWIRELQIEGESLSGDKNSAHKFKEAFLQSVEEGYSRDDVYNVDETGLNWKALPRKSFASK